MICVGYPCDTCKHQHSEKKDGWEVTCDAFPERIPTEYLFYKDVTKLDECNNGYKYEYDESKDYLK